MLGYLAAKIKHGGFHIGHAGQISSVHRFVKIVGLLLIAAFQIGVLAVDVFDHNIHKRAIQRRLEAVGLKVFVIIDEVKGIGLQLVALLSQFLGADGGN